MRKSTFSLAERLKIVSERTDGRSIEQICRDHQISPATFYKWKDEQQTETDETKKRLDVLEKENKRLKKMYSELSIDHEILKEGYDYLKKIRAQNSAKK
jgi:putative transposase